MKHRLLIAAALSASAVLGSAGAARAAGKTQLTWYGHSAFKITTPAGRVILIDPWITNPMNKSAKEDLAALDKVDLILVSHGHVDHVGDAVGIAKRTGAKLVATYELGAALVRNGFPAANHGLDTTGNFGGELELLGGEVRITFVPAVHTSTVVRNADTPKEQRNYAGAPGGFLIVIKGGPSIYHTGDTDLFGDMALVRRVYPVDVMLACIGGRFTMGPERAADAVELVRPALVVPMHFGTFPMLQGTPKAFGVALRAKGLETRLRVLQPGESLRL